MVRLYAKTMTEGKMISNYKCAFNEDFELNHFEFYIKTICEHFDSPSPIILAKHIRDYLMFGTVTFREEDFVEITHFEKLIVENNKQI